jgi:hypothetical protein
VEDGDCFGHGSSVVVRGLGGGAGLGAGGDDVEFPEEVEFPEGGVVGGGGW